MRARIHGIQVFVCDQLYNFCETDFSHWTYWMGEYFSSTDIHRYVTSFGGCKISDVMPKPHIVSRFVWPNSKPTSAMILLKPSLKIGHTQESNIELMLLEEFINRHSINRGFWNGLPSHHNVVQFPSVYMFRTGLMVLNVENCAPFLWSCMATCLDERHSVWDSL